MKRGAQQASGCAITGPLAREDDFQVTNELTYLIDTDYGCWELQQPVLNMTSLIYVNNSQLSITFNAVTQPTVCGSYFSLTSLSEH